MAPEKGGNWANAQKRREPVVHFGEWTTGYLEKGRKSVNAPKRRELVVHSGEWATSYPEKGRIPGFCPEIA